MQFDEDGSKKEISSVNVPAPTTEIKEEGGGELKKEKEEDKEKKISEGGKATVGMFATGATERKKSPETDKEAQGTEDGVDGEKMDGKDKDSGPQDRPAVGPHDEAGEEAERVAEELFGYDEDE
jgi:hypothetical protein